MHKLAFKFRANVYGRNQHCGQLTKIVVDPNTWQLTDLIVEDGLFFKQAIVLPIFQVEDTLGQTVNLKIDRDQLKEFQAYGETIVEEGASDWPAIKAVGEIENMSLPAANNPIPTLKREKTRLGVSNDALILNDNTIVTCLEGSLGHLSHVIVDAQSRLISDLVFEKGKLLPKQYIVSTNFVDSLGETVTQIAHTRSEADQLPEYAFPYHR